MSKNLSTWFMNDPPILFVYEIIFTFEPSLKYFLFERVPLYKWLQL